MKRNILVAHGGGPTTVINASLFGVIDEAMRQSSSGKVFGAIHGVEGVLNDELIASQSVPLAIFPHCSLMFTVEYLPLSIFSMPAPACSGYRAA